MFFVALPKFNLEPDNADAVQMNISSKRGPFQLEFIGRVVETTLLLYFFTPQKSVHDNFQFRG